MTNRRWLTEILVPCTLLILVAAMIRLPGLGKWCLSEDEFYIGETAARIQTTGAPLLKGGDVYARGIGLTYLTAAVAGHFGSPEFALRLPALVAGVLTVAVFFVLCRMFLPLVPSLMCSGILVFSSWHIEFSRFARFYAPFQLVFISFLVCLFYGYYQRRRLFKVMTWLLAALAVLVYEGSVFLPIAMMVVFLDPGRFTSRGKVGIGCGIAVLLALNVFMHQGPFDHWLSERYGSGNDSAAVEAASAPPSPADSGTEPDLPVRLPSRALIGSLLQGPFALLGGYLVLLAGAAAWSGREFLRARRERRDIWTLVGLALAGALPAVHQYGLLAFALVLIFLNRKDTQQFFMARAFAWLAYFSLALLFWLLAMWALGYAQGSDHRIFNFLIGYPPAKQAILLPFRASVPVWGGLLAALLIAAVVNNLLKERWDLAGTLVSIALVLLFMVAAFDTGWKTTRYCFFFFPVLILIGFIAIHDVAGRAAGKWKPASRDWAALSAAGMLTLGFMATEDFNLAHAVDVASPQANFRLGPYEKFSRHWYNRVDVREPAQCVNRIAEAGDVVALDHVVASPYLEKPFAAYVNRADSIRYDYYARNGGTTEKWTGVPIIPDGQALADLVPPNREHRLLMIGATEKGFGFIGTSLNKKGYSAEQLAQKHNLSVRLLCPGVDGRAGVWEFRRNGDR